MKSKLLSIICLFFICSSINSATAFEPIPTTRDDLSSWFDDGKSAGATHMVVVSDDFSYEYFPVYVFSPQDPYEIIHEYSSQQLYGVMEVYALFLDKEMQLKEPRAWHPESQSFFDWLSTLIH